MTGNLDILRAFTQIMAKQRHQRCEEVRHSLTSATVSDAVGSIVGYGKYVSETVVGGQYSTSPDRKFDQPTISLSSPTELFLQIKD